LLGLALLDSSFFHQQPTYYLKSEFFHEYEPCILRRPSVKKDFTCHILLKEK